MLMPNEGLSFCSAVCAVFKLRLSFTLIALDQDARYFIGFTYKGKPNHEKPEFSNM